MAAISEDALGIIERTHLAHGSALCACGCGLPAPLVQRTNRRLGKVMGQPLRFVSGHNQRGTTDLSRHEVVDGGYISPCWRWLGSFNRKGYGRVQVDGVHKHAHRAVYEAAYGAVSSALHLDHLCRNKWCVNPTHVEPATPLQNERRKRIALQNSARELVIGMIDAGSVAT